MKQPTASQAIKKELKAAFPNTKFSVRGDYNAVRIDWTDGPTIDQVKSIGNKYEMGSFDGMTDSYNYTNRRDDIPQVSYVFENREISPAVKEAKKQELIAYYGAEYMTGFTADRVLREAFSSLSL